MDIKTFGISIHWACQANQHLARQTGRMNDV
ncbi:hypothetical protein BCL64_102232 [Halomonas ventosae]|uniref:Uncharacterized protein n=1 Tax=Halomonas ventosae TaxID=229007 RepID=A0A2T0VRI3_9GAMM|nr:hypothetical protein BCL64_102232 [Halomonas ventosae]